MNHPKLQTWQKSLKNLMNDLDDFLEDEYGNQFRLHPVRKKRGKTSNKAHDGLFDIVASFSLGAGSEFGRGYVVDVHLSTLENVPEEKIEEIEKATLQKLRDKIPEHFPGKNLKADIDGNVIKIYGDLSLGTV